MAHVRAHMRSPTADRQDDYSSAQRGGIALLRALLQYAVRQDSDDRNSTDVSRHIWKQGVMDTASPS